MEKACNEYLGSMKGLNVYELVDIPVGCKNIATRWIFRVKVNEKGEVVT